MERLERDARRICVRFRLRYRVLEAERANVKRRYGVCFSDGTIRIRLRHATTGRPLKYSSLVSTLCHELAHLRHFNHGPRFQNFYAEVLEWARREGIYCPGPSPGQARTRLATASSAPVALAREGASVRSARSEPEAPTVFQKVGPKQPERNEGPSQLELFGG
jgi:hypothetical protein